MMNDSFGGGGFRGAPSGGGAIGGGGGGSDFGSAPGSTSFGGDPIVQSRNPSPVSGPIMGGSFGMEDGGMVPGAADPGQGQEGGIPMSGAAQPAAATPGQRLQSAGNLVQMLLMHGMKKHNLMGPDGKPMKVGAYAAGGLVRSFSLGGSLDDTETSQAPAAAGPEAGDQSAGAIPSGGDPSQTSGVASPGPSSVASSGTGTPSVMQYVAGADAPPDGVMDQLHSSFKRGGRSGNDAALAAVAAAGEKSPDLGFSVVQGFRKRYDRSRAAAAQALDMGNLDGGVSHLNEAFNNLPTAENANFSHDGQDITGSINGKSYQLAPKLASNLLAKGQHFDNVMFTGAEQPIATLGATTLAAKKMAPQPRVPMSTGNPQPRPKLRVETGRPAGTQVAANNMTPYEQQLSLQRDRASSARDLQDSSARNNRDLDRQRENDRVWERTNHPEWSAPGNNAGKPEREKFLAKVMGNPDLTPPQRKSMIDAYDEANGHAAPTAAPSGANQGSSPGQWVYPGGDRTKAPVWRAGPAAGTAQTRPAN